MLTVEMLIQIHAGSKTKINLEYIRPGGGTGYCYIDPETPLKFQRDEKDYPKFVHTYQQYAKDIYGRPFDVSEGYFSFYKQESGVCIYVQLKNVRFQNKKKFPILQVLYGKASV